MTEIARFDPAGGPITAEVSCDPNRDGSYTLTLWEAETNERVLRWLGNFLNPEDDEYTLPGEVADHDGRLLEALVVVAVPPGVGPSTVALTVRQDGNEIGKNADEVPPGSAGAMRDLFVRLEAS